MERSSLLRNSMFRVLAVLLAICVILIISLVVTDNPTVVQLRCGLRYAGPEMAACVMDPTCRTLMSCFRECEDPDSSRRQKSFEKNQHLQHPHSIMPCTTGCMDDYDNEVIDVFLDAFMTNKCAADSKLADTCVDVEAVRPFSNDPAEFDMAWLVGEWHSIATGGWDHWDCQKKIFFSPEETGKGKPWHSVFWGTYRTYPMNRGGKPKDNYVHEEIYPNDKEPDGPTFRTRFKMWGTESEEEWHIVAFSKGNEKDGEPPWVLAEICVYTPIIKHVDVCTVVMSKEVNPSKELQEKLNRIAKEKVGATLKYVDNSNCAESPDYERKR